MTQHTPQDDSIVKKGGIASDAEAEDVTRDTYGFGEGTGPGEGDEASKADARRGLEEILPDEALEDGSSS